MQKTFVVITSVNPPTNAIQQFLEFRHCNVVIVADKKTVDTAYDLLAKKYNNLHYLSIKKQLRLEYSVLKHLPWNHYGRKIIGYIYAIRNGADVIIDSDDDNIPLKSWTKHIDSVLQTPDPKLHEKKRKVPLLEYTNIYKYFTNKEEVLWPRGLPLDEIHSSPVIKETKTHQQRVLIWQFLANKDPDVDAIYRLIFYHDKKHIHPLRITMRKLEYYDTT